MSENGRIFPRNLTARAAHRIAGNPDISRPEDAVANCFPGLDMDLRNLDRRFFPGLVFEFIVPTDDDKTGAWQGAQLLYCEPRGDADLQPDYFNRLAPEQKAWIRPLRETLFAELIGKKGDKLSNNFIDDPVERRRKGIWYLDWIKQGTAQLDMYEPTSGGATGMPYDGLVVWRLVRGLEPGEVTIQLRRRTGAAARQSTDKTMELKGWRRWFTDSGTGVLSRAYQPGELTMSMCSPWQHDFRDCACHYWASNRPDVVFGAVGSQDETLPGGAPADPILATTRLDWMRADRDRAAAGAAQSTMGANRPFQMDHFQINRSWQRLNIVLRNTEINEVYRPPDRDNFRPFNSPLQLYRELHDKLAGLELTLALEYLYARFSLIEAQPDPRWPNVVEDAALARHYLLLTAVSEMQHLRWVNELLRALATAFPGQTGPYKPALEPATHVPTLGQPVAKRPRALRRLTPDVLEEFIAVERPSGGIDGLYARVIATLAQEDYPPHLHELASRIASDGTEHYSRLQKLKTVFEAYAGATPYLRNLEIGPMTNAGVKAAVAIYESIRAELAKAYSGMADGHFADAAKPVELARTGMTDLLAAGDALAAEGFGIPFWPA